MLLGTFDQRLDEKNRVTIPARLRERFADGIVMNRGFEGCIQVFTRAAWDAYVDRQLGRLDSFSKEGRQLQRYLFGGAVEADLDRQGRVAINAPLMKHAGLRKEIAVTGVNDHLEIWDADAWRREYDEFERSAEHVAERLAREAHH